MSAAMAALLAWMHAREARVYAAENGGSDSKQEGQ